MNEPIELTTDEKSAAAAVLQKINWSRAQPGELVGIVVSAINRARAGDPVGTIRRHASGQVAVRLSGGTKNPEWSVIDPASTEHSFVPLCLGDELWPVVYRPGVES